MIILPKTCLSIWRSGRLRPPSDINQASRDSGLILGFHSATEGRRYKVTPSLIGWAQTSDQPSNASIAKIVFKFGLLMDTTIYHWTHTVLFIYIFKYLICGRRQVVLGRCQVSIVAVSSISCSDIHLRVISQEMPQYSLNIAWKYHTWRFIEITQGPIS